MRLRFFFPLLSALLLAAPQASVAAEPLSDAEVAAFSRIVFFGPVARRDEALEALVARGRLDVASTLILAVRYRGQDSSIIEALRRLVGEPLRDWKAAMLWQEAHPDIVPHASFEAIKLQVFDDIDPGFDRFLGGGRAARDRLAIRLEEIVWGGAWADAIPSLDRPKMLRADEVDYLLDDDLVFGLELNGDRRAYPLRIMGWHEMMNDVVGGVPVALAYCPLCGSGILYETAVAGLSEPLVFGSSGLLYRSNKLMFDRGTGSLWHHLTGKPVSGPLRDRALKLRVLPMAIARWADWKAKHPRTRVLALTTGYDRNYESGAVYKDYFASADLLYPARTDDSIADDLAAKAYVFGLQTFGHAKAWPLDAFDGGRLVNDHLGDQPVVLIGDTAGRTVRAYARQSFQFETTDDPERLATAEGEWRLTETFLHGPQGQRLPRLPGRITFWFAWNNHLGFESELYR